MWYTLLITLVIDFGGLLLMYALLRDRIRRATSAAAQIAELRDEVSRLVVELNQTTERNVALLENRVSGLTDLLAAADRKIGLLRRESEKHDVGAQVYSRLAEGGSRGMSASGSAPTPAEGDRGGRQLPRPDRPRPSLSVELSGSADAGTRPVTARPDEVVREAAATGLSLTQGRRGGRQADKEAPGTRQPSQAETRKEGSRIGHDTVHQRVMMLSNTGFSASLIAARVGIPLGEVELIIALERQRTSQAPVWPDGGRP